MTDRWNPLFSSFIKSSVLKEGPDVVSVWAMLMSDADRYGESDLTASFMAERLRIDKARVEKALDILQNPDPDSTTSHHEGRRIERIDGKWHLLTHADYREKASRERALATARKRKQREKEREEAKAAGAPIPPELPEEPEEEF